MEFLAREFIKQKRESIPHNGNDIEKFISLYLAGEVPDYQMSSWLMAAFLNGLDAKEATALTKAMLTSGYQFDFTHLKELKIDKHSTGGVGDKTSMILAPLVAACGIRVPMIAGRGLGHTGGTLDKLEAIQNFNTRISKEEFIQGVEKNYFSIMGQTEEICPADKRIYSLRDVTATIESVPLICASIMSKKLAEGIDGLVMDVKVGSGAFMKTLDQATLLAESLRDIALNYGCSFSALITDMDQPLGRHCGNANEIYECEQILKNTEEANADYVDCKNLSLELAAHMVKLGKNCDLDSAKEQVLEALESGRAWDLFLKLVEQQGGTYNITKPIYDKDILAEQDGYLSNFNTEAIGIAGIQLGAGRKVVSDKIDPLAGIYVHKSIGDKVSKGEVIFSIYAQNKDTYASAEELLRSSFSLANEAVPRSELVKKIIC